MKNAVMTVVSMLACSVVFGDNVYPSVPQRFVDNVCKGGKLSAAGEKSLQVLRRNRQKLLEAPLANIVENKKLKARTGDVHDYISTGPYWWPDPEKPDGLPYIRRDGRVNPDYKEGDNTQLNRMSGRVRDLAFLWKFDHDSEAGARAVAALKCFFLDEKTRMNPHLNFGQAVPGRSDGRCYGLIETYNTIAMIVEPIIMLQDAPGMTPETYAALVQWYRSFAEWMKSSKIGQDELNSKNNHGLAAYYQFIKYALFIGEKDWAQESLKKASELIVKSVAEDGSLPYELTRTKSWGYSNYAFGMMTRLVLCSQVLGQDFMAPAAPTAAPIRRAVLYLCGFVGKFDEWKHEQIEPFSTDALGESLLRLYAATHDAVYLEQLKALKTSKFGLLEQVFLTPELPIE